MAKKLKIEDSCYVNSFAYGGVNPPVDSPCGKTCGKCGKVCVSKPYSFSFSTGGGAAEAVYRLA